MNEPEDKCANLDHLNGKCQIMWHSGYYDGPQSGVLMYEDEMCFFMMVDEYEPTAEDIKRYDEADDDDDFDYHRWYRKHAVFPLSDDDRIRLVTLHALWQGHMGLHSDYWPINGRSLHPRRSEERTVPCLHYGPSGDRQTGWDEYKALSEHWTSKHGKYTHHDKEPIGFIYHEQLYGGKVAADGTSLEVENEESE